MKKNLPLQPLVLAMALSLGCVPALAAGASVSGTAYAEEPIDQPQPPPPPPPEETQFDAAEHTR
jgi:hypothetical protein